MRTNKSRLNYEEFLHAFEDGRKSSYGHRATKIDIIEHHGLSAQEAEIRIREHVAQQTDVLGRVRLPSISHENLMKIQTKFLGGKHSNPIVCSS